MSMITKFGTLSLKSGLNTFLTCKIVKKWTLDPTIPGIPQATELEQSSHEILDYMAQL